MQIITNSLAIGCDGTTQINGRKRTYCIKSHSPVKSSGNDTDDCLRNTLPSCLTYVRNRDEELVKGNHKQSWLFTSHLTISIVSPYLSLLCPLKPSKVVRWLAMDAEIDILDKISPARSSSSLTNPQKSLTWQFSAEKKLRQLGATWFFNFSSEENKWGDGPHSAGRCRLDLKANFIFSEKQLMIIYIVARLSFKWYAYLP